MWSYFDVIVNFIILIQMNNMNDINNNNENLDEHHNQLEQLLWNQTLDDAQKNQLFTSILSQSVPSPERREVENEIQGVLQNITTDYSDVGIGGANHHEVLVSSISRPEVESSYPSGESDESFSDRAEEPDIILR